MAWSASDRATWLTLSPTSGTGNGTVIMSAAIGTLTTDTYSSTVMFNATGASAVTLPVTLTITAAADWPVSPASLSFTATLGTNTATTAVTGGGTTQTETVALTLNTPVTSSVTLTLSPNTETDIT